MSWDNLPVILKMLDNPILFEYPPLGTYLSKRLNNGKPFTYRQAAECEFPFGSKCIDDFEMYCQDKAYFNAAEGYYDFENGYTFNEFKYFKNAYWETEDDNFSGRHNYLTEITIPESPYIHSIPKWMFAGFRNLKKVILPETVDTVDALGFYSCYELSDINLDHIKDIGQSAFAYTNLKSVFLPEIEELDEDAFRGIDSLGEVVITSDNLGYVHNFCFAYNDTLKKIAILSKSLHGVGYQAFASDYLEEVYLKGKVDLDPLSFSNIARHYHHHHPTLYVESEQLKEYYENDASSNGFWLNSVKVSKRKWRKLECEYKE